MKILRLFDSLKFMRAMFVAVVATFAFAPAHAATLPAGYTELEYLESTGEQYVELSFGFDPTDMILADLSVNIGENLDKYMVAPKVWNPNANRFAIGVHNYVYTVAYGGAQTGSTYLKPSEQNDGQIHKWIYGGYVFSIPELNISRDVSDITFGTTTSNIRLFYGYNGGTKGKISYYKHVKANGTSVELIPVRRDSDGVLGMYDLADSNPATAFHTNAGTGTFVAGPAAPIKIATTKYNEESFAPVETRLDAAVAAVDTVVTQTMNQAQAIDQIATSKQTRPDEGCTAKYCLLVEDEDGTPHWYPIAGANGVEYVLPAGYTKLEYLKKTEMSQYIQTNYIGNLKSRYEGAIYIGNDVSYWTRDAYYIASRETENGNNRNIALGGSSSGFYVGYGSYVSTNRFSLVQGKKVDFITDYVNRTWSVNIDGVAQTETISSNAIITSFVNTAPLQIFFVKTQDYPDDYVTYSSFPGVRVYYLRIYEDNSLVHEFIPVRRDSDGVLGMYDLVDANPATAFYINSGTGEFVAGPDM